MSLNMRHQSQTKCHKHRSRTFNPLLNPLPTPILHERALRTLVPSILMLSVPVHARDEKHCFGPRLIKWRGQGDRRGVVERITNNKANAVVLWDGRISTEYVPIRAIESEPAELG